MAAQNAQIELACISYLMHRKDPEMLAAIQPDYLDNRDLSKIFLLIRKFYLDNGEFIGWDLLKANVERACRTAENAKFLLSIIDQMKKKDLAGLTDEILLSELRDYHKFRTVLLKVDPLVRAVENKDIAATLNGVRELYDSVFVENEYQLDDADIRSMAGKKIQFSFRTTGIPPIDERGGLIVGGYTIIAAPAKMGKSTVTSMIAAHQYLHEEGSGAIFSYEMGRPEVRARVLANVASLDIGELMSDTLSPADQQKLLRAEAVFYCKDAEGVKVEGVTDREAFFEELFQKYEKRDNRLFIFDERLDYDNLMVKMNLLATTRNVKTFIVDYPWLIPRGKAYRDMAGWEYQLQVSKNWKTFAHQHSVVVLTPAQLDPGKKGEDSKLRFVTNAINDCDLALFMTEGDDDKTLGTVTFKFAAMRNFLSVPGKPGFPAPFKMSKELNHSRFSCMEF